MITVDFICHAKDVHYAKCLSAERTVTDVFPYVLIKVRRSLILKVLVEETLD